MKKAVVWMTLMHITAILFTLDVLRGVRTISDYVFYLIDHVFDDFFILVLESVVMG